MPLSSRVASRESCVVWPAETSCFILVLSFRPFRSAVPLLLARPLIPGKLHCWEAGGDMCAKGRSFLCFVVLWDINRQEEWSVPDAYALSLLECVPCPCELSTVDHVSERQIFLPSQLHPFQEVTKVLCSTHRQVFYCYYCYYYIYSLIILYMYAVHSDCPHSPIPFIFPYPLNFSSSIQVPFWRFMSFRFVLWTLEFNQSRLLTMGLELYIGAWWAHHWVNNRIQWLLALYNPPGANCSVGRSGAPGVPSSSMTCFTFIAVAEL